MQGVECDSSDRLRMLSEHRQEALNSIHSVKGNSWKSDRSLSLIEQQERVRRQGGKGIPGEQQHAGVKGACLYPEVWAAQEA